MPGDFPGGTKNASANGVADDDRDAEAHAENAQQMSFACGRVCRIRAGPGHELNGESFRLGSESW